MIARPDGGVGDAPPCPGLPHPHVVLRFTRSDSTEQYELSTCSVDWSASQVSDAWARSGERTPSAAIPAPHSGFDFALEILAAVHQQHPFVHSAVNQVRGGHVLRYRVLRDDGRYLRERIQCPAREVRRCGQRNECGSIQHVMTPAAASMQPCADSVNVDRRLREFKTVGMNGRRHETNNSGTNALVRRARGR